MRRYLLSFLLGLLAEHLIEGPTTTSAFFALCCMGVSWAVLGYVEDFLDRKKTVTVILKDGRYADPQ